ncbi:MAG: flagellar motor switch protein FliN [Phycisphaeraceae bacterium]|nr:flagellar motor switch protein FliN [Phycisphaeraceae bacterium]
MSESEDVQKMVDDAMSDVQQSVDEISDAATPAGSADGAPAPSDTAAVSDPGGIQLLGDVDLNVMIELGRTRMMVEDVLKLGEGSVVELDKLAGDPVDIYVNHRLVARGEVLVLNDNFCIRVSEIVEDLEQQAQAAVEEPTEVEA